jgi:hypothetical protein
MNQFKKDKTPMNKKSHLLACLIAVASSALLACDDLQHGETSNKSLAFTTSASRTEPLPRVATQAQSIEAATNIDFIIDKWREKCVVPNCPTKLLKFSPAQPRAESLGQRILIFESFFVPDSAMLRYKKRVLGFYKFSKSSPKYEEYFPDTEVYSPLDEISEYLSNLPYHVPAEALDIAKLRNNGFAAKLKHQPFLSHGVPIFEWLADLVPEAQFVIAEFPTNFISFDFCHFDEGDNLGRMSTILSHAMIQVLKIIDIHKINYVNISEAPSPEALKRNYNMACATTGSKPFSAIDKDAIDRFLELETFVFRKLSEIPNISVFQSLPNTDHSMYRPENKGDELVAAEYENFVRVGYFSSADYEFDERGGFDSTLLAKEQLNQVFCASAYINGGVSEGGLDSASLTEPEPIKVGKNALHYRSLGFRTPMVIKIMSTSWATPLALAHAIYLKNMGGPQSPTEFRNYMKTKSKQPRPKLIDPLRFSQFELYAGE